MNSHIQNARTYIAHHRDILTTAAIVAGIGILVVSVLAYLAFFEGKTKVVYRPAPACEMFESSAAGELFGQVALKTINTKPVIDGHVAVSQCGYTDGNREVDAARVAALVVRSGVDDEGVLQNKTEFVEGQPSDNVVSLRQLGDGAYFDKTKGQLNILDEKNWLLLSYGVGSDPTRNTLEDAVAMASVILDESKINQVSKY